jgi:anti-anti-sigma regulatory factor
MGELRLVDQLARLQLNARRRGYRFTLVDPPARLRELIELVGLTDVLVEPRREPEEGEKRGRVEEERELGDPPV